MYIARLALPLVHMAGATELRDDHIPLLITFRNAASCTSRARWTRMRDLALQGVQVGTVLVKARQLNAMEVEPALRHSKGARNAGGAVWQWMRSVLHTRAAMYYTSLCSLKIVIHLFIT